MNPASMRSSVLSAKCNRGASLLTLLLCLLLIAAAVNAERDFNVNDSQVSGRKAEGADATECAALLQLQLGLRPFICLLILIDDA